MIDRKSQAKAVTPAAHSFGKRPVTEVFKPCPVTVREYLRSQE